MRNLTLLSWLLTAILATVSIAATAMRLANVEDRIALCLAIGALSVACVMLTNTVVTRREARRRLEAIASIAAVAGTGRQRLAAVIAAEQASGDVAAH